MDPGLAVRTAHLLAMGVLAGGSALCVWSLLRRAPSAGPLLRGYEWLFWGAVGVSVATGVGNLGAFGAATPAPETAWGSALRWKLLLAALGLPLGALRSLLALGPVERARGALLALHLATLAGLVAAVVLAGGMAHGS